jgi:UPF0716 family protein affecting phage T7 exclusion
MKPLLLLFAAVQLAIGALLWLAPGFFFEEIGPYGARNDHYMGDLATWYLASGAALAVAVRRAAWRLPVLFLVAVQYALHSLNHLVDVGEADPSWLGPANLVSLLLATALLGWMLREAAR